jgi:hypothetical protein
MKAVIDSGKSSKGDFYTSSIAPVNHCKARRCCLMDTLVLAVLFVEILAVMRLILAN